MTSLIPVFLLALVDSINPSALVATVTLLTRGSRVGAILAYVGGIFVTYFATGVLLMLGIDALLGALQSAFESRVGSVLGAVVGVGMLLYALFARKPKDSGESTRLEHGKRGLVGLFLLGVTITGLELPTALPYVGAIGILAGEGYGSAVWLPVLLAYNVIFVLPPLLLTVWYRFLSANASERFVARLRSGARETTLWIVGIVGFYLLFGSLSNIFPSIEVDFF